MGFTITWNGARAASFCEGSTVFDEVKVAPTLKTALELIMLMRISEMLTPLRNHLVVNILGMVGLDEKMVLSS